MKKHFTLILILLIATSLRFYNNINISLWHDEAFSALLIKYPWSEMFYRIGLDVHPPMYYIFLRFWHYVFGDSLLALRGFTVFFGVATVWAAWAFVREAFKNEKAALWAAALVALNPFQIQYATEARMYTMGAFFALIAGYFLVKALNTQKQLQLDKSLNMPRMPRDISLKRNMIFYYLGFAVSVSIMLYTHYYLLFTAAAICFYGLLYLFFHHQGGFKKYLWLSLSYILVVILYLPWVKIFLFQYKQVGAGYWIPPMDRWSIPSTLWTLILGFGHDVSNPNTRNWLVLISLACLFIFWRFLRKTDGFAKWMVLMTVIAPFAGSVLFYLLNLKCQNNLSINSLFNGQCQASSVYLVRYFLYTSAFLSIVLALWLKEIKWKWLASSLFVVYALLNLTAFSNYWKDLNVSSKPGMNAAVAFLSANVQSKDKLYVGSSFEFFNLKYYINRLNRKDMPKPLLYTGGRNVEGMLHFEGTAILTDRDLIPDFNSSLKNGDTIWLLWTNGFGGSKPQTPNNWTQIDQKEYAEVRPYVGTFIYITEYKVN